MILINKDEAAALRERYPGVHIVRTMKQKSKRGRYYCEETPKVMRFISEIRGEAPSYKKMGGERYPNRKNAKRNGT